jgi:branched-chain amino acid transport system substrate-binding protein
MKAFQKVYILFSIALIAAITGLFSCHSDTPIRIGFVGGLSGKYSDLGIDGRRGVELAVSRVNQKGGLDGRPVEIVAMDDAQDETTAKKAVKTLLAKDLPVIIGHMTSSMTMATLPIINKSKTLLVSPTTSTPLLKDIDDNFIRSCAVTIAAAGMEAKYLRETKDVHSVGVIYDLGNKAYTQMWYESFKKSFLENGGQKIIPLTFTSKPDIPLLPLILEMQQNSVEALVIVANSVDAAMLCQQVRKANWQIPLALADWAATEQLISLGGQAVEGVMVSQFFNRKSTKPAFLEFKKEFENRYKSEPGFGALHAYNAAMMVFTSMQEQKKNETLKQAILRISHFQGLQDDIVINPYGDSNHPTYMGVIKDGHFMILEDYR